MSKIGTADIKGIMLGSTEISKAYLGSDVVFQKSTPEFIEVEYIENTSTAYIDSGIIPNANTFSIEVKYYRGKNITGICVCGARNAYATRNYSFWTAADATNAVRVTTGSKSSWTQKTVDTYDKTCIFTLANRAATLTVDGTTTSWTAESPTTYGATKNMYIFNCDNNGAINNAWFLVGKIYYFKIYKSGVLQRDFVPAYQVSTGKYGLLDKVNNVFYLSPNGVEFSGASIT
jgi:hypothetical protein